MPEQEAQTATTEAVETEEADLNDLESADLAKLKEIVAKERKLRKDAESGFPEARRAKDEAEALRLKLKEYEDRDKTEAEKLQEERDSLLAERDALRTETLRRDVAGEKGLTPAQAKRLVGTTREELEADADDILEAFPATATQTAPKFGDAGQGYRGETVTGPRAQFADLLSQARRRT